MQDLTFNLLMFGVDAAALLALRRWRGPVGVLAASVLAVVCCAMLSVACVVVFGWHPLFATMRFCAWGTFLHGFVLLIGAAVLLWRESRWWTAVLGACAAGVVATAYDAFLVEPTALELTRYEIATPKLAHPLRIGVLADLQTDDVGDYEREAIERLLAEKPDLLLLAGDYVHELEHDEREREWGRLNKLFHDVGLAAPLGVYAVEGNVDSSGWARVFDGLDVEVFPASRAVDRGDVRVTGLSFSDGGYTRLGVEGTDRFHIVLGHMPDFALGEIDADLLVAGHTHGGQVALPFLGPPITLSRVPRSWASGLTDLGGGRTLVVSRGVGMERGQAPRLRFLCRPEIVVIDLVPAGEVR